MKWQVSKTEDGLLLKEYLTKVHGFSRRIIRTITSEQGCLLINEMFATVRRKLVEGDVVEVIFPSEKRGPLMHAEPIPLVIIYEDEDVIVIDKQAGMPSIPSHIHKQGTLANALLYHYEQQQLDYTVHIVTRLDRDTSGLMLVAKHRLSHSILSLSQQRGEVNRRYQAIISGHLKLKEGTIDAPIARKSTSIIERIVDPTGKKAITHFRVVEETNDNTVIQIQLETGRTHQIRVHFSYLGNPLVGDDLYGGATDKISRQALHCTNLSFIHPRTKKKIECTSDIPNDMKKISQF
ncbi:RluA family pseudouridine synthase [Paraliobacillus ryukyuensis]|uniref:RluA family pseudouridine synthase n=1 Tax=Paraliobacillus ryukyuensis TaxID=200904 RepID=UPI0009A57DA8|nr:RluA family pseudouridine synthase [Paraliobacillus ryukyuensis]